MAITQCPECKNDVSTHAELCPHCGYPIQRSLATTRKQRSGFLGGCLILLILLILLALGALWYFNVNVVFNPFYTERAEDTDPFSAGMPEIPTQGRTQTTNDDDTLAPDTETQPGMSPPVEAASPEIAPPMLNSETAPTEGAAAPIENNGMRMAVEVSTNENQLVITNRNNYPWEKVQITLNQEYNLQIDTISGGETAQIDLNLFRQGDGTAFDPATPVNSIFIASQTPEGNGYFTQEF